MSQKRSYSGDKNRHEIRSIIPFRAILIKKKEFISESQGNSSSTITCALLNNGHPCADSLGPSSSFLPLLGEVSKVGADLGKSVHPLPKSVYRSGLWLLGMFESALNHSAVTLPEGDDGQTLQQYKKHLQLLYFVVYH